MTAKSDDNTSKSEKKQFSSPLVLPKGQERVDQNRFAHAYAQREDAATDSYYNDPARHTSLWAKLSRFFLDNAFTPQWFPEPWRHPAIGYLLGIVLQVLAALGTILLMHIFPTFEFSGLFEILGIAIIAVNFGTGPSLLATVVSIVLLDFFVLPPHYSLNVNDLQSFVESVLFLLIGITISIVASQVEQARRNAIEERTLLNAVIETVPDSVSVYDAQGRLVRVNSAGRRLEEESDIGYPALTETTQRLRTPTGSFFPQKELPVGRALKGESVTSVEMVWRPKKGDIQYFTVSAAPLYNAWGKIGGAVSISHDITERRRLETYTQNALHALLEMAQTLIQSEPAQEAEDAASNNTVVQRLVDLTSGVLNCKRVGIISVLPQTERLLPVAIVGLTPEQEQLWWGHMPQKYLVDMAEATDIERLRNGEVVRLDATLHQFDEQYVSHGPRNSLLAPMTVGRKLVGLLSLDYDDDKHTYTKDEMALAGAVAKLTALVIERERLLLERSEAQANEIALSEANQRINEFLSIASHELKTPITTIKGSTQLLERRLKKMMNPETLTVEERTRLQEEAQDLLRRTNTQVNRLIRLINDMLDMSRIQAHKIEPHMEYTNLISVLQDVVQEQSRTAVDRVLTLQLSSDADVFVFADVDRIEQVLTNVISNALKYSTPDKPVEILLQKRGKSAYVAVHDEGPGLPAKEQVNVFERFYRVKGIEVRSGSGVGLGLGLYISKTIIDLHKGQIGVDSEVGKGSTFWFTLPLAE